MPTVTVDLTASDVMATIEVYRRLGVSVVPEKVAEQGARYAVVDDPDDNHVGVMSPSDQPHG